MVSAAGVRPESDQIWDPGRDATSTVKLNQHLTSLLCIFMSDVDVAPNLLVQGGERLFTKTDLDSHANMPVVGRNAYILSWTNKTAVVSPYTPGYEAKELPICDAAVMYEDPYTGTNMVLVVRNALYIPSMKNNLIPPFIMQEKGVQVKDTPKIHMNDPDENEHAIVFPKTEIRIPLQLWGVFSYFPSRKPTVEELQGAEVIYMLTPSQFHPHDEAYAANELNMLDWQGNIVERHH